MGLRFLCDFQKDAERRGMKRIEAARYAVILTVRREEKLEQIVAADRGEIRD